MSPKLIAQYSPVTKLQNPPMKLDVMPKGHRVLIVPKWCTCFFVFTLFLPQCDAESVDEVKVRTKQCISQDGAAQSHKISSQTLKVLFLPAMLDNLGVLTLVAKVAACHPFCPGILGRFGHLQRWFIGSLNGS